MDVYVGVESKAQKIKQLYIDVAGKTRLAGLYYLERRRFYG